MADGATQTQRWLDVAAITGAALCLAHCLAVPMLLVAVPTLAGLELLPHEFHLMAFAFAVPTSAVALWLGWRRHQRVRPVLVAGVGLALLGMGALGSDGTAETLLSLAGALLLGAGHGLNWRALRHRRSSCPV
ncbi:MerC domain-containing protein [Sphingoaurantiacus capsulatus]|uniref:MerC domain-containing protein n=1 Tax=Sphingoaurantiacus capsulatus TaxID=1771310 RepID=A0ABV7X6Y6_9SPHN